MSEFKFIKNKIVYYFVLIFILNALEMLLELVASRVMSPYFGTSMFVWTAIIGIILLSSSIGYLIGGKLSEEKKVTEFLFQVLGLTALFIAFIPLLSKKVNPLFIELDVRLGALFSTILLFLVPSVLISIITPFLMKSILSNTKHIGDYSGKIHAVIAVGSLFGTFVGGFFLIPKIGTNYLLCFIALLFFILMLISIPKIINKKSILFFIIIFACIIIPWLIPMPNNLLLGINIDTKYSRIFIQDVEYSGRTIRFYNSGGAYFSAMYLDDETELVYDYTKCYSDSLEYNSNIENTLMIGGAAYSFPKYWISHTDKKMTVVEIDEESEKIARKYFKLSEVIDKYDSNHERLTLITDDGRVYLNKNKVKYDAIFNDAFSGSIPVETLTTKEAIMIIYNSLTDEGIYMSNILGEATSEFMLAEMKTMKTVFPYVYIYKTDGSKDLSYGNYMVVASKKPLKSNKFINVDYSNGLILTDNYAPVDKMVGDSYFNH